MLGDLRFDAAQLAPVISERRFGRGKVVPTISAARDTL